MLGMHRRIIKYPRNFYFGQLDGSFILAFRTKPDSAHNELFMKNDANTDYDLMDERLPVASDLIAKNNS